MKIIFRFLPICLIILGIYVTFATPTYAGTCASGQTCYNTSTTPEGCSWAGTACTGGGGYCYSCSPCADGCYSSEHRTGLTRDSTGTCGNPTITACSDSNIGATHSCGGTTYTCLGSANGWGIPTPTPTPTPTPAPMSIIAVGFSPDRPPSYQYYDDETIQLGAAVSTSVNSVVWTDNGTNIGVANCSNGSCTNLSWSRGAAVSANESHTFTTYAYNDRSDWWNNPSRSKSLTIIPRNVRVTEFTTPSSGATYKYYEDIGVRVFVTTDTTDVRYYDGNATSGVQIGTGSCSAGGCSGITWGNNKTVGTHTIYAYPIRNGTVYWNNYLTVSITITLPPAPGLSSPVVTPAKTGLGGNLTFTGTLTNATDWKFALDLHCHGNGIVCGERIELGYGGETGGSITASGSVNKLFTPGTATDSSTAYIQIISGKRGALESYDYNIATVPYTVVPLPTISSVSVNSAGNPQITITGTGLKPTGATKGIVRINGFDIPGGNITDANWNNTTIIMDNPPYAGTVNRVCLGGTDFTTICSNNATPSYKIEPDNQWWNFTATSTYSISGIIFDDKNKNGQFDPPIDALYTSSTQRVRIISGPTLPPPSDTTTGAYTFRDLAPGQYTVQYADPFNGYPIPSGYQLTTPASLIVTVGSADVENINFGISNLFPWFQGMSGDMRIDAGFIDKVPQTASQPYASLDGPGGGSGTHHGVLFSGNTAYTFGPDGTHLERASTAPQWVVKGDAANSATFTPSTPGTIAASYDYLLTTANQSGSGSIIDLATICTLSNCTLPTGLGNGVYKTTGDLTLNAKDFPANKNYVFLVGQDLFIKGKITVPVGSTVTFAAARDIHIDKGVGESTASSPTTNIEGFYSTGRNFIIEGNGSGGCPAGDRRLNVAGSIVVNAKLSGGSLQNQRDLCNNDVTYPSLYIVERPDFIINAPEFIKQPNFLWQEVAP